MKPPFLKSISKTSLPCFSKLSHSQQPINCKSTKNLKIPSNINPKKTSSSGSKPKEPKSTQFNPYPNPKSNNNTAKSTLPISLPNCSWPEKPTASPESSKNRLHWLQLKLASLSISSKNAKFKEDLASLKITLSRKETAWNPLRLRGFVRKPKIFVTCGEETSKSTKKTFWAYSNFSSQRGKETTNALQFWSMQEAMARTLAKMRTPLGTLLWRKSEFTTKWWTW